MNDWMKDHTFFFSFDPRLLCRNLISQFLSIFYRHSILFSCFQLILQVRDSLLGFDKVYIISFSFSSTSFLIIFALNFIFSFVLVNITTSSSLLDYLFDSNIFNVSLGTCNWDSIWGKLVYLSLKHIRRSNLLRQFR